MRDDPYTLYVTLDIDGRAEGSLYIDDEHTMDYREVGELSLEYLWWGRHLFTF